MDSSALQQVVQHHDLFGAPYAVAFLNSVPEPTTVTAGAVIAAFAATKRRRRLGQASN